MYIEEKFKIVNTQFENALNGLNNSVRIDTSSFETDLKDTVKSGIIQKFELTVELFWKSAKLFIEHNNGIVEKSPKTVVKSLYLLEYINEEIYLGLMDAINDRNEISHIYNEENYNIVLEKIPTHIICLNKVFEKMNASNNG
jgi:nucleotidyltransferase substrate binding protein (TIGR01987 family)